MVKVKFTVVVDNERVQAEGSLEAWLKYLTKHYGVLGKTTWEDVYKVLATEHLTDGRLSEYAKQSPEVEFIYGTWKDAVASESNDDE